MRKTIGIILAYILCMTVVAPVYANNYGFSSGEDTLPGFGKPTSNDNPVSPDPMSENIRRNKDAAYLPPPYFYGSGDIPTDPSSLYHNNIPGGSSSGYGWTADIATGNTSNGTSSTFAPPASGFEASTSTIAATTEPLYYSDGSIGTLYVARTGKTIKVYEGEQLDNLKKGAGHFSMTSAWDGNVALAGHNRGGSAYFSFVKDMKIGDKVTYTTQYGSRVYEVFSKEQINEYDYSKLGWSAENLLTLITCVENAAGLRWLVQAKEVR